MDPVNGEAVETDGALEEPSDALLRVTVGRCLRERREKLNLTQRALAERAGLRADYISRLERGVIEPRLSRLTKIAVAVEMTSGEFVTAVEKLADLSTAG